MAQFTINNRTIYRTITWEISITESDITEEGNYTARWNESYMEGLVNEWEVFDELGNEFSETDHVFKSIVSMLSIDIPNID